MAQKQSGSTVQSGSGLVAATGDVGSVRGDGGSVNRDVDDGGSVGGGSRSVRVCVGDAVIVRKSVRMKRSIAVDGERSNRRKKSNSKINVVLKK